MRKFTMLIIIFIIVLGGCQNEDLKESKEKEIHSIEDVKVGFSQMENNSPWRVAETNSIIYEAERLGVELVYTDAKGSVEKQIEDVKSLLDQEIDYLLLAPKTYEPLGEALQLAKAKSVPVILVDRIAEGVAGEDYLTLIMSDKVKQAEFAGKILVEATNGNARIIELRGTVGSSSEEERTKGFMSVIDNYEYMEVIASVSADFSRAEGRIVMESLIREYKGKFNALYAQNDEMAIGAIMALKAAGIEPGEEVIVVSIDGEKDALKAIIANDLHATIECTPFLGSKAFDVINQHIKGQEIKEIYINEDRIFTIENAAEYIDEAY